ncbi:hypothetical protein BCR32DRAFT_281226 [Anaeromyces robustus]|uniref:Uncharacterized protein n=1 Tax=Anaeromyces robustus TaxID=1754192 RepID=A0A1Y1X1V2_9FUNG|nr:hypothetical protein BCR32DRAFT_281226 [Anaeromyces robustus]|eukprot:ORX79672.1 hypothetical protein BCR32DRAFT_281226 [Anaeromyces robustus]
MNNFERNTELFYKELNNDSKDGIYLYEPLFNHEKIKNHREEKHQTIRIVPFSFKIVKYIFKLIIPNKFLLEQLFNEDDKIIDMFVQNFEFKVIFPFLYKYNFITAELFNLFYLKDQSNPFIFEIFEFLTDNNKVLLEKMANSICPLYYFRMIYYTNCRDEKLLKCLTETFTNANLMKCENFVRVPLPIPYYISKKYCDDKFSEEFINDVFSDDLIEEFIENKSLREDYLIQFKRHNFSKSHFYYCLVDEYIKLKEPEKCPTCFGYDIENLYKLNFVINCLKNKDEISKILNDPNFLFNSKFDTNNATEYFLITLTYIISLIHNKGNTFLIKLLLKNFSHAKFLNNKIKHYIFKYGRGDEEIDDEEYLIGLLKNTPNETFNRYIYEI